MARSRIAPSKVVKKALFLLIDALRYDVLADEAGREVLVPNLAKLAKHGFVRRVVANAQSTQFVMPSLFTQTYPLDHGGYNNGIRGRPKCFVESLKEAGYETHVMATCNQLGVTLGYDRGFDTIRTTTDYRTILEQRISRTLQYELKLWQSGETSEAEAIDLVQQEFGLLLDKLGKDEDAENKAIWPPKLRAINAQVAAQVGEERELLSRDPLSVMRKLLCIPPAIYRRFLGEKDPGGARLFFWRAIESVAWRTRKFAANRKFPPYVWLSQYACVAGEAVGPVRDFIMGSKETPWFIYMHVMDVHDCRAINRVGNVLYRFKYFPRWFQARIKGLTRRRFIYDAAVMYVDECLGKLFDALESSGQMDDVLILATGDHGFFYAQSPRSTKLDLGFRTHYEDIEVPLMMYGAEKEPSNTGLTDSMGVAATLLEALSVPPHQSFKGRSAFGPGRSAVISENCGSGNADISRRDIYFTVTTETHKMMVLLRGSTLSVERLFDLRQDPTEIRSLVGMPGHEDATRALLGYLWDERGEILNMRGVCSGLTEMA